MSTFGSPPGDRQADPGVLMLQSQEEKNKKEYRADGDLICQESLTPCSDAQSHSYSVFSSLPGHPVLPTGTFTSSQDGPPLPSSEPAKLGPGEIHADQNSVFLMQELE